MTALVALGWVGWVAAGWWIRRPLPRRWDVDAFADARGHDRMLERIGGRIQRRISVLAELAPLTVGATATACVLLVVVSPPAAIAIGLGTVITARWRALAVARAERRQLAEQMPQALDLLRLCVEAGLSPRSAMGRLARHVPEPLGVWCRQVSTRADRGMPLAEALLAATAPGHPMELTARTLASAEHSGVAIGGALEHLARQSRAAARRASLERVHRLPVQMLIPLVCCTLPAFLAVAVVPLVISQLRSVL